MNKLLLCVIPFIVTGCKQPEDLSLGGKYRLAYSSYQSDLMIAHVNSEEEAPTVIIGGQVLDYTFDDRFILAIQKDRQHFKPDNLPLPESDEIFKKSTFREYWIIDKKAPSIWSEKNWKYSNVYGPLNKPEYIKKLRELNVPQHLALKKE